ncbi:unnamed protein product [Sympodiomycopsis kandeliae]
MPSKISKHGHRSSHHDARPSSSAPLPVRTASELTEDALELLREMLMYLDPQAAEQLPLDVQQGNAPTPISDWNVLYSTPAPSDPLKSSIKVLSYPEPGKNLFCVRSVVPDITARQFWTLMAESGNRHMWDSTVQEGSNWRWCSEEASQDSHLLARSIASRIEYLKFGSIFMVAKPRDMILLSADVRLPSNHESSLRLVSSCKSIIDPSKPPVKGYTRFELGVGGFMVEELGSDEFRPGRKAIRVTQLSNLGEMAAWVPSSVIKMVAQSLVPRSLNLIAKAAGRINTPNALLQGPKEGCSMKEEDVVKGAERWSKARGLPGIIGQGVLARERAADVGEVQANDSQRQSGVELHDGSGLSIGGSGAHSRKASGSHSREASGSHSRKASGSHSREASGSHSREASGSHSREASGSHPRDVSGTRSKDVSAAQVGLKSVISNDETQAQPYPLPSLNSATRPSSTSISNSETQVQSDTSRSATRPSSTSSTTEDEQPLLSLTLQRLSTQLQENSPPPLSPSSQQRLALQGYFTGASPATSSVTPSSSSADYFQHTTTSRQASSPMTSSPWGTSSEAGSYLTFGLQSGERTVPGSLTDYCEGTRFPFDSSTTTTTTTTESSDSIAPSEQGLADDTGADDTIVVGQQDQSNRSRSRSRTQSRSGGGGGSHSLSVSGSEADTPSSRSSRADKDLRFKNAAELDKRLQRISRALQTSDDSGQNAAIAAASPSQGQTPKVIPQDLSPRKQSYYYPQHLAQGYEDEYDEHDEVNDLLAEALSMSLSAKWRPQLLSSPRSPPYRPTSRMALSPPRSPPSRRARREASELSAMLLAGSDALVSALAPGARETTMIGAGDEQLEHEQGEKQSQAPVSPQPRHAFRNFFSGTTSSSNGSALGFEENGHARPEYRRSPSSSSSTATATTQVSNTHAIRQSHLSLQSIPQRSISTFSSDTQEGPYDSPVSRDTNRSWGRSITGAPYALALGMMAMVWARGQSDEPYDDNLINRQSTITTDSTLSSTSSSIYSGSAKKALLRTMSASADTKREQFKRSISSPIPSSVRVPEEGSYARKWTRGNYLGNQKLLTSHFDRQSIEESASGSVVYLPPSPREEDEGESA